MFVQWDSLYLPLELFIKIPLNCFSSSSCALSGTTRNRITDLNRISIAAFFPSFYFPSFVSFYFLIYGSINPWSRGTALSRTTPRILCSWLITRTTRSTASARSTELDLTKPHVGSCPEMVLERASPLSSSGCWCPVSRPWLWTSRIVTPAPLGTQSPVTYYPAARSCPSPPQTESQSLPRSLSHRHQERQSCRSSRSPSPKCLTRCESRQFQRRWMQLWRARGLWPTAPPLGVSINWTWETSQTSTPTHSSFSHLLSYLPGIISHPTSLSHLLLLIWFLLQHLHRWIPSASLLTLSSPSVAWAHRWSAYLQLRWRWVWRIPRLRPQLPRPRLRLGPATQRLHLGFQLPRLHRSPSVHQLHRAPSSLRFRLGQSSPYLHLGTTVLWLCLVPSSLCLLLPSSSTSVLCRSGSTAAFRSPAFTSVAEASGSALALRILGITLALRLSVAASGSTTTCSAAVGQPHGVGDHSSTMAPPSMGHHRGCGLGFQLAPPAPGLPLAPPTLHSPMDFYVVPGVVCLFSCSTPSSRAPTLPPQFDYYGARTRLSGRGRTVTCLCFPCDLVFPVRFN